MSTDALWRRVKELERLTRRSLDPPTVIRIRGGLPDGPDIAQVDHQLLERADGESMAAFEQRVLNEADTVGARLVVFGGLTPIDW